MIQIIDKTCLKISNALAYLRQKRKIRRKKLYYLGCSLPENYKFVAKDQFYKFFWLKKVQFKPNGTSCKCKTLLNYDKSAASCCHQVAAWVLDMFCDVYLVKKYKIINNSATT